jgi:hypothetical protein
MALSMSSSPSSAVSRAVGLTPCVVAFLTSDLYFFVFFNGVFFDIGTDFAVVAVVADVAVGTDFAAVAVESVLDVVATATFLLTVDD